MPDLKRKPQEPVQGKNTVVERRKCSLARENDDSWFRQLPLKPLRKIFSVESGKGADGNFLISVEKRRENPFWIGVERKHSACVRRAAPQQALLSTLREKPGVMATGPQSVWCPL